MTAFELALRTNIRRKIKELVKDGTVAMGLENLRMVTKTPPPTLPGAPSGPAGYNQVFQNVCEQTRDINSYLI